MRTPAAVGLVLVMVVCGCSGDADGDTREDGGTAPRSGPAPTDAAEGVPAERIDTAALLGDDTTTIAELVTSDDLAPTAVGSVVAADGSSQVPVVWHLDDDQVWRRTDGVVGDDERAWLADVTAWDGGGLAVGTREVDGRRTGTIWQGGDGDWAPVGTLGDGDGDTEADGIASHGGQAVVIGTADPPGAEAPAQRNRVWSSTDAVSWQVETVPGIDTEGTSLTDVALGPGGALVTGFRSDDATTVAVVWHRSPAGEWAEVDLGAGPGSRVDAVVDRGDGFVVGGTVGGGATSDPATWATADGRTFKQPTTAFPELVPNVIRSGGASITDLSRRGDRLIASSDSSSGRGISVSDDGSAWRQWEQPIVDTPGYAVAPPVVDVGLDGTGRPLAVVADGPNLLVPTGDGWGEASGAAEVLDLDREIVRLAATTVHEGAPVIVGTVETVARPGRPSTVTTTVWSRARDGWSEVRADDLPAIAWWDVTSTDLGPVAVGNQVFRRSTSDSDQAAVATGDDDRWTRVAGTPNQVARTLTAVAPWDGGWVAVGFRLREDATRAAGAAKEAVVVRGASDTGTELAIPVALDGLDARPGADHALTGVCTGATGVVVVGEVTEEGSRSRSVVALSVDLDTGFTAATADDHFAEGRPDASVDGCEADGRGELLLHGGVTAGDGQREPLVWRSSDGTTWARLRDDAWGGPGGQVVGDAVALDQGWLLVGSDRPEGEDSDVALWHVADDETVTRVPLTGDAVGPADEEAVDVLVDGDSVVIVGMVEGSAAVWTVSLGTVLSEA